MTERFSFNLLDEPWIPVLWLDKEESGSAADDADAATRRPDLLSVLDVLREAHTVAGLDGDIPTQIPTVLRLLLAILHRAFDGPPSLGAWKELWDAEQLPMESITEYLERYHSRFDLFCPERPFLQAAGLRDAKSRVKPTNLLMPQVASGNNVPLFSGRGDSQPIALTPAQAARWLLHAHAFDTSGMKTGAVDDPAMKANKSSGKLGPLGQIGVVISQGPTLRETLLLNLVPHGFGRMPENRQDSAVWEADEPLQVSYTERKLRGPADLFTFPARRIRLVPSDGGAGVEVRHIVMTAGDQIAPGELRLAEPHTMFRRDTEAEKKEKRAPIYVPLRHVPGRVLWRGLPGLLAERTASGPPRLGKDSPRVQPPGALRWIEEVVDQGYVPEDMLLVVASYGAHYGTKAAVVDDLTYDDVPLPVAVLAAERPAAKSLMLLAVSAADRAASALRALDRDLRRSYGDRAKEKDRVASADLLADDLYFRLDDPFRRLATALAGPDSAHAELSRSWAATVTGSARRIATTRIAGVPPGGILHQHLFDGERHTVAFAEERFSRSLAAAVRELT
ncbi:CRISPR system Cascade subunit CasA [Frankia sp. AiPs1]|uniref:type I-E CRISPR-associated protein Cse1/CasA n=1 Tax=Frankia sp. AiPa1 TaxID=573492 RepID=UPI00202B05EF|nr:type I-E CRISPR-associated protein Cse1/CasA [Frankia sp. AiPa1]MCL9760948.1 type I-E CRISPR-associated protein Cse1/CasA [Frankia sp. AiPa1]